MKMLFCRYRSLFSILFFLIVAVLSISCCFAESADSSTRPNIILIMTDDQDVDLGSLEFMPKLRKYLRNDGVFFPNSFVSSPICCPSRSSMLTGLYVHNHNVLTNSDNCSSVQWQNTLEKETFAVHLQRSGYLTGYFGKYLNKYSGRYIPDGWNVWKTLVMNSRYYNYTLNENGWLVKYGFEHDFDYLPNVIMNHSLNFIREAMESSRQIKSQNRRPFFAILSFPSPHGPEDSDPKYQKSFLNVTTHHTPAYNFIHNQDKQWVLRQMEPMNDIELKFTDLLMSKRLQTLQTVDEAVEKVNDQLKPRLLYESDEKI